MRSVQAGFGRWISLLALCCTFLALSTIAFAQANISGNISGTVTDSSGAVVPNATVSLFSVDRDRVERVVKTDQSGVYSIPVIPAGNYSMTVEASGFKKVQKTGITLNVADKRTEQFTLAIGASGEVVNVQAEAVAVNLVNSTGSDLISGTQVRELTLNNRNYVQLLTLSPGVSSTTAEQFYVGTTNPMTGAVNTIGFQVNGQRTSANNWVIDGADNVDRGSNLTLLSTPSVDAIAEFKLVRSNYDAEYGRSAGGQVQVITRSGTAQWHGGAYEFWRNNILNADNYMTKRARWVSPPSFCAPYVAAGNPGGCDTRPLLRYNNFGWNLGGPIPIGGLKKNTFFFFSQEWRRAITYATQVATMPTAAEVGGQFTTPICISFAANGSCTGTGTAIPTTSFSPTAVAYIKDVYNNTTLAPAGANHLVTNYFRNVQNFRQENIKIDHNFGSKLSVYGRYTHDDVPTEEPLGLFGPSALVPNVANTSTNSPGWTLALHGTATFSPTLLMDVGYNFSYGAIVQTVEGVMASDKSPDVHPTLPYSVTTAVIPFLSFTNSMSNMGTHPAYNDYNRNHQIFGNLTKVMGKHTMKFGGTYYYYQKTENAAGNNGGTFNFTGAPVTGGPVANCTGANAQTCIAQGWANFLLGRVNTFTQTATDLTPDIRQNSFEFFGQDEWRLKPNFTLSFGLRWSIFRQPYDNNGYLTTFDPRYYDPTKAFAINPADGNRTGTGDFLNGIIPTTSALAKCKSLGSAVSVPCWADGTKAPFGNKIANEDMHDFAPRFGFAWDPFSDGKTSIRSGFGAFYDTPLVGILEQNIFANQPFSNNISVSATNMENPVSVLPSIGAAPVSPSARMQGPWVAPRSYQYNLSVQHQFPSDIFLEVGYYGNVGRHLIGVFEQNQPAVGAYVGTTADASGGAATSAACGTGPCVNSTTTPRLNQVRPYKGYLAITAIRPQYNSNYNSLQTSVKKQFHSGSLIGIAYTWSKALTDNQTDRSSAPQNTYNAAGDYGPTQQDRRHIFTANYVYGLPFYRSQQGVIGHIVGGWETSGIFTAQSGTPNTVTGATLDRAGQGCLSASTTCGVRPDQISDPNSGGAQTIAQWFNTAAFIAIPGGQVRPGTERRGPVIGPGFWRFDLSVMKNIKITERFNTQIRMDAFNVFNHTNFNGFGSLATTSALFGQISTATSGVRDPRLIALGAKLTF